MLKVKLKDMDELYFEYLDLVSVTYLQSLVDSDYEGDGVFKTDVKYIYENTKTYLIEKQIEIINNMEEIFKVLMNVI